MVSVLCQACGASFDTFPSKVVRGHRFCSASCRLTFMSSFSGQNSWHWTGGPTTRQCSGCGATFTVTRRRKAARRFCSNRCFHSARLKVLTKDKRAYVRLKAEERRARVSSATARSGGVTEAEWQRIVAAFHHRCPWCFRAEPEVTLTMDHITPLSRGGVHAARNIQPLCGSCNSRKRLRLLSFDPDGFAVEVEDLRLLLVGILEGRAPLDCVVLAPGVL